MAEGAVTILPKRASVDGEAGKHKTARRGNETDHVSEDVLKEVIVVKTFSYFSQRLTVTSRAAPCPTTAGTSGSLSSGRRTSAASWGCTARDPAAPRNVQVGNTGGNTEVKGQHGPREETSFVTQQRKLICILLFFLYLFLPFSTSYFTPVSQSLLLYLVIASSISTFSSLSCPPFYTSPLLFLLLPFSTSSFLPLSPLFLLHVLLPFFTSSFFVYSLLSSPTSPSFVYLLLSSFEPAGLT